MKTKRILITLLSLVVFLVLIMVLNLQMVFNQLLSKEHVEKALSDLFGCDFVLQKVRFHVWKGVEISGLRLPDQEGDSDLLFIEKVRVSYRKDSLLKKKLVVSMIELIGPELRLSSKNSLARFMPRFNTGTLEANLPGLRISQGRIVFDYPEIFHEGYLPVLNNVDLALYPYAPARYVIEGTGDAGLMGHWTMKGEIDLDTKLIKVVLGTANINLSAPLAAKLSDNLQHVWNRYQPRGLANLKVELTHNPANKPALDFNVRAECLGSEITFIGFPYKLRGVEGNIIFYPSGARIMNLISKNGSTRISLNGITEGYKKDAGFKVDVDIKKLLLDAKLYEALGDQLRNTWLKIQPQGVIDIQCEVTRKKGLDQPINYQARLTCQDCQITHKDFPYPLTGLQGDIEYDNGFVQIKSLVGWHDKANITIKGKINDRQSDAHSDIVIEAQNIELNDYALKEAFGTVVTDGAQIWELYQPAGLIDLVLSLKQAQGENQLIKPYIKINCKGNSIRYGTVRYPLSEITGQIEYQDSKISLKQLKATSVHSRATDTNPRQSLFEINGELYLAPPLRSLNQPERFMVEIKGTDLVIDRALKNFLPETFKPLLTELDPSGLMDIVLKLSSTDSGSDNPKAGLNYSAEVELSDGVLKPGVGLTGINGRITIKGTVPAITQDSYACGSLKLDQLRIERNLLENVSVQFIQEGTRFSFYNIKGAIYQGAGTGFLVINSRDLAYSGRFSLAGIDLKELGRDLGTYNVGTDKAISGKLAVEVEFQGKGKDSKTIQGKGRLHITQAQLWDVPIFLSILNVFSLAEKSVFREGEIKFKIVNGKINLRSLKFVSDAVTLKGRGTMEFNGVLDLELAAEFASSILPRIKIIEKLKNLFTKGIYSIKIEGTFGEPKTSLKPLPVLDIFKAPESKE